MHEVILNILLVERKLNYFYSLVNIWTNISHKTQSKLNYVAHNQIIKLQLEQEYKSK